VRAVRYLIFNEGYTVSAGDSLTRRELASEAIRLARTLCKLLPNEPENAGLLALMLLQDSRLAARASPEGELMPLEEQDRSRWDTDEIREGLPLVERAWRMGSPGPCQIQAAIAAIHPQARTPAETDWNQIKQLYHELQQLIPSVVVALNAAVAVAMNDGLEKGLADMEAVGSELDGYYLYHAARADLLRRLHRSASALDAYRKGSRSPPTLSSAATCAAAWPKSTARSRANIPVV
jgi:RNA polymerase sigma-70 factor (ECF subfamily)